jgi:transposase
MYSLIFLLYAASGGELDPKRLKRLGIDEIALVKGQKNYCAVLVNLDTGKLIAILEKRT